LTFGNNITCCHHYNLGSDLAILLKLQFSAFSDILEAVDRGDFAALVLLDLTAAFDTVDHTISLERLNRSFGIFNAAHDWFRSYTSGRTQCVCRGMNVSSSIQLNCGVPHGSVLGSILFVLYTADLPAVIQQHRLHPHLYADDTKIFGSARLADVSVLAGRLAGCVDDVGERMSSNRLQLNCDKTELLWCSTNRCQDRLPTNSVSSGGFDVSNSVRDLGILFIFLSTIFD
jgi:hypothetical protein